MVKRETIQAGEALSIWEDLLEKDMCLNKQVIAVDRYVRRYCERYEGGLAYKNSTGRWNIYKDVWVDYLCNGFPDIALKAPVMDLPTALRYLHLNGIPSSYKLREFRKDLKDKFPQWIIKNEIRKERITRGHLHKFIGIWNGNR